VSWPRSWEYRTAGCPTSENNEHTKLESLIEAAVMMSDDSRGGRWRSQRPDSDGKRGDARHLGFLHAARRDGRGAEADAARHGRPFVSKGMPFLFTMILGILSYIW